MKINHVYYKDSYWSMLPRIIDYENHHVYYKDSYWSMLPRIIDYENQPCLL